LPNLVNPDGLTLWTDNQDIRMVRVPDLSTGETFFATLITPGFTVQGLGQRKGDEPFANTFGPEKQIGLREMVRCNGSL
jgi:hypothetical protein